MKKITLITSFDERYYNKVGKYCLETILKFWDPTIDVVVYTEDMHLENNSRYTTVDFSNLDPDYFVFQNESRKPSEKTFAKKAYSIIHAMENIDTDILIWIDADVITKKNIDAKLIHELVPLEILSTHFGVWHHQIKHDSTSPKMFSCETGFFALNKNHPQYKVFSKRYKDRYVKREKDDLRRFYDGDVYGAVVKELEPSAAMNDLNPKGLHKTPMPRSILKDHIVHFKHGLKKRDDFDNLVKSVMN
jgi:hypothetical protein